MDIREKEKKDLNFFEKILNRIPGFKGYYDREMRRDSDKLQREFIEKKLISCKDNINDIIGKETRKKDLSLLTDLGNLLRELEMTISEIRYSDRGYSGFFDLIKVNEKLLDEVYEADLSLLESVEEFKMDVEKFALGKEDGNIADKLSEKLDSLKSILKKRDEILMGFSKNEGR